MASLIFHALKNVNVEVFPFPEIYLNEYIARTRSFDMLLENTAGDLRDKDRLLQCFQHSSSIVLVKTFNTLEGKYMDYLSVLVNKKIIPDRVQW
ncbi:hypothetical protein V6N13_140931 [Hibiscus sabdariffa]|uniref:Uncharacterized protein n=1 Tax=Hibiscus sabdariffa TaxID=183260 RepID=A0ABR2Q1G9_9ROSI